MDTRAAAEVLLSIIESQIEMFGYARYSAVRDQLARDAGEEWIVLSRRNRRNIAPEVQVEFRKLEGREEIEWNAPRQRWTREIRG